MEITQPLHTALLVSDLAQAEQFYGTVLGLQKVVRSLNYPGVWYQIGTYQLHLIVDETSTAPLHNAEKWGRNRHIALGVTDLTAAQSRLQQHGYPFQLSASGRAALFTRDPDGNVIELTQV